MVETPLLSLKNVSKYYGKLCVADKISFDISKGETVGIIGPNGAGKTTLFNLIAGSITIEEGTILYKGDDITSMSSFRRCHRGLARTFQIPKTFNTMSVYENVLVGAVSRQNHLNEKESREVAIQVMEITGLTHKANVEAQYLSVIDRKALGLACALSTSPELLLLDEVAGGLTDHELHEFVFILDKIKKSGTSIIWIEHAVYTLANYVDRMIVINFGELIADGNPDKILEDPKIKEIYLGVED